MMFHEAYKRIWLQVDPDGDAPIGVEYPLCEGATWCQDKVNDNDVEYVRADEVAALRAEVVTLTKERDEAIYQTKVATQEHADMKPVAWLYECEKGSDVWQHQLQGEVLFDFVPNPHTCTSLYTADQLREAQVKVLQLAAQRFRGDVAYNFVAQDGYSKALSIAAELDFMADAIRGLA